MREARRLLTSDDLTVAAIAHRVGYRDPGYFVRRFRRHHGGHRRRGGTQGHDA
ncbi:helix-turn-helix domain-containing protein [Actinomycetospora sp. NBC_00405]|uniref:helix-turn-helix domain-containing protein n=1 Tax=Actinomycetospora sp. NBC_00405 TaxID=2975952 RepID=UPI002E21AD6B